MRQITLTPAQISWCRDIANKRYLRNKGNPCAKYENTPNSHSVGIFGELGTYLILRQEAVPNVIANFHHDDSLPDILANGKRVEVKTWSDEHWPTLGCCIQEDQYPKIQKYDYIIWASTWDSTVVIQGYSLPGDFEFIEPKLMGRGILNRQRQSIRDIGEYLSTSRS